LLFLWVFVSFALLLVVGVCLTAFGWRVGLWAGGIAALWPLLATYGAVPLADAPTSWIILGAAWMLLLAAKRKCLAWALGAGALIGVSCWLRAHAMLLAFLWAMAIVISARVSWRRRMLLAATVVVGAVLVIAPVVVRNACVFHAFAPTGLGTGSDPFAGLGEPERGARECGVPADGR